MISKERADEIFEEADELERKRETKHKTVKCIPKVKKPQSARSYQNTPVRQPQSVGPLPAKFPLLTWVISSPDRESIQSESRLYQKKKKKPLTDHFTEVDISGWGLK
jgi:hypothetical protein